MIATEMGRMVFTLAFIVLALQSGRWLVGASGLAVVIHHLGGMMMSLGMAAMAWPQWLEWPIAPQALIYLCFAGVSAVAVNAQRRSRSGLGGTAVMHRVHHVVMLVGMGWMVVAMGAASSSADDAGGTHQHSGMDLGASASISGVVLAAAMIVMTLLIVVRYALSTDDETECGTGPTANCALMGAAMVAMSWTMVAG